MKHYNWYSLSEDSQISTNHLFKTISFLTETFVFVYVGINVSSFSPGNSSFKNIYIFFIYYIFKELKWNPSLMIIGLISILKFFYFFKKFFFHYLKLLVFISRAVNVFFLSLLLNIRRKDRITLKMQLMQWFAGNIIQIQNNYINSKRSSWGCCFCIIIKFTSITTKVTIIYKKILFNFCFKICPYHSYSFYYLIYHSCNGNFNSSRFILYFKFFIFILLVLKKLGLQCKEEVFLIIYFYLIIIFPFFKKKDIQDLVVLPTIEEKHIDNMEGKERLLENENEEILETKPKKIKKPSFLHRKWQLFDEKYPIFIFLFFFFF